MFSWLKKLPRPEYNSLKRILLDETWFEVFILRPSVFVIYEPYQCEEVISYLIEGGEKSLLIDTGLGIGNIKRIVDQLTSLPVIVINTHSHHDHIGDNWRFQNCLIGVKSDFAKKNFQELVVDAQEEVQKGMICIDRLPSNFRSESYRIESYFVDKHVNDGDCLDLGAGKRILIISTPGHTPDSISLLYISERLLFVGDNFYQGPIYLFRPETNLHDYVSSMGKLVKLMDECDIDLVVPSHNTPNVQPEILRKSYQAINDILSGKIKPKTSDNCLQYVYEFDHFSYMINKNLISQ